MEYLTEKEAADMMRVARATLWKYRHDPSVQPPIPWACFGKRSIRYPKARFLDWLEAFNGKPPVAEPQTI